MLADFFEGKALNIFLVSFKGIVTTLYLLAVYVITYLSMESDLVNISIVITLIISFAVSCCAFIIRKSIKIPNDPTLIVAAFMVFVALLSLIINLNKISSNEQIYFTVRFILPSLFLISSVIFISSGSIANKIVVAVSCLFFILFFLMLLNEIITFNQNLGYLKQTNWGNITIATSALACTVRYKLLRFILVILLVLSVLFSLKRSGVVFLVLSALFYLYFYFSTQKSNRTVKTLSVSLITSSIIVVIYFFLQQIIENELITTMYGRIQSISEDGGSGRLDLWVNLVSSFLNMGLIQILFGNSVEAGEILQGAGIHSAHNDYIGALVNFGLVGLLVMLYFFYRVFLSCRKFVESVDKHNLLPGSLFIGAFLTFSMTSGIFIYSTMFLPMFLMLSIMLSSEN